MGFIRTAAALGTAALVAAAVAPSAFAQEYPPPSPTAAQGVCFGDIPYLAYQVDFGDDDLVGEPMTITFVNPNGEDFVIVTVVPAVGETGATLWPGASVDPEDWPGWELNEDGIWVETTEDEGAFTRAPGGVELRFETNPTLTTSVTYPPSTAVCANPTNPTQGGPTTQGEPTTQGGEAPVTEQPAQTSGGAVAASSQTTPTTGANAALPVALGVLGVVLGVGLVLAARRRA